MAKKGTQKGAGWGLAGQGGRVSSPEHSHRLCWLLSPPKPLPSASQHHQSHPTPLTPRCCHAGRGFGGEQGTKALRKDTGQRSAPARSAFALGSRTRPEAAGDGFGQDPGRGKHTQPPGPTSVCTNPISSARGVKPSKRSSGRGAALDSAWPETGDRCADALGGAGQARAFGVS